MFLKEQIKIIFIYFMYNNILFYGFCLQEGKGRLHGSSTFLPILKF